MVLDYTLGRETMPYLSNNTTHFTIRFTFSTIPQSYHHTLESKHLFQASYRVLEIS
jgi:hypothetical protein